MQHMPALIAFALQRRDTEMRKAGHAPTDTHTCRPCRSHEPPCGTCPLAPPAGKTPSRQRTAIRAPDSQPGRIWDAPQGCAVIAGIGRRAGHAHNPCGMRTFRHRTRRPRQTAVRRAGCRHPYAGGCRSSIGSWTTPHTCRPPRRTTSTSCQLPPLQRERACTHA
jgi:hypothetical protein